MVGDGHGNFLKLVPNEFTTANIEHIRNKVKSKVNESVEGDYLTVWTSSKDSNLFNLYIKKMLTFGNSGGSNYGFASYAVIEPPFSDDAEIGYSSEFRAKIYGDNIFEFRVPTSKVLFLLFDEYKKTKQGGREHRNIGDETLQDVFKEVLSKERWNIEIPICRICLQGTHGWKGLCGLESICA